MPDDGYPTCDASSSDLVTDIGSDATTSNSSSDLAGPDQASQNSEECKDCSSEGVGSTPFMTPSAKPEASTYKIIPYDPSVPPPDIKRYAHHGKRRRSYTEELFRCQFSTKVMSDNLICGALLWRNRPNELREHLLQHKKLDSVRLLSDDEVLEFYTEAKRIFLESIPDDDLYGIDDEDLDEDDLDEVEGD